MLQLNNLTSLVKKRKRVGRGGSRGGTSGKGHKGKKLVSGGLCSVVDLKVDKCHFIRRLPNVVLIMQILKKFLKLLILHVIE